MDIDNASDNAMWTIITLGLISGITVIAVMAMSLYTDRCKVAFENGYTQTSVHGSSRIIWVKPD